MHSHYHEPSLTERIKASKISGLEEFEISEELRLTAQDVADSESRLAPELRKIQSDLAISAHSGGTIVM